MCDTRGEFGSAQQTAMRADFPRRRRFLRSIRTTVTQDRAWALVAPAQATFRRTGAGCPGPSSCRAPLSGLDVCEHQDPCNFPHPLARNGLGEMLSCRQASSCISLRQALQRTCSSQAPSSIRTDVTPLSSPMGRSIGKRNFSTKFHIFPIIRGYR